MRSYFREHRCGERIECHGDHIRRMAPIGILPRRDLPFTFILTDLSASEAEEGPGGGAAVYHRVLSDAVQWPVPGGPVLCLRPQSEAAGR